MTLILSNEEIEQILSMKDLVPAIEEAYIELIEGRGANRLRSDDSRSNSLRGSCRSDTASRSWHEVGHAGCEVCLRLADLGIFPHVAGWGGQTRKQRFCI